MAGDVDNFLWSHDNVTALCTSDCRSTANTWWSNVQNECANDYINVRGRKIPPATIPGRMLDGMNIACLTPDTDVTALPGIVGTEITSTVTEVLNSTQPDDPTAPKDADDLALSRRTYLSPLARDVDAPSKVQNVSISQHQTSTTSYCLLDSYTWVGQDIIRPDCPPGSTEPQCLDPTDVPAENERIANLYPDEMLCSDCFLKLFYLRMASPYLPDLYESDYHLEQYLDIVDVCNASMPDLQVRILPLYPNIDGVVDGRPEVNRTATSAVVACDQTITLADLELLTIPDPYANGSIYCDALSEKYGVTTGDLQLAFDEHYCLPGLDFTSVCLPRACDVVQIAENTTCTHAAELAGANITVTQLLNWNPNLNGLCDALPMQYICTGPPGGFYIPPPSSNSSTGDAGHVRGGGTGDSTGSGSAAGGGRNATFVKLGDPAPSPTQDGITPLCTEYVVASAGDGCDSLTNLWRVPEKEFFEWNTILGPNGENCTTQLWANTYYCIDIVRSSTTTTPTTTPTATPSTTTAPAPGPTQPGIISTCNKYAESIPGLGCYDFAVAEGITPAQLYAWNPVLGAQGENCGSSFWAGEYYCVGVLSTTTAPTPTTTSGGAPGPTQAGIISTCNKYAESIPGLGCYDFAVAKGITPELLYEWNTILGKNGENCGSQLWAGEYYCVGVKPPGPTQDGIISTCNKYAESIPGMGCYDFAVAKGITPAQLYKWNTVLGQNGENCGSKFWAEEYYCIGVSTM